MKLKAAERDGKFPNKNKKQGRYRPVCDELSEDLNPAGLDGYGTDSVWQQETAIVSGAAL